MQGHKGWDVGRESSRWSDPAGRGLKCVRRSPSATGPAGMFLARKRQEKASGKRSDRCPCLEMRWTYTQAPRGPRGNKRREDKDTLREADGSDGEART